MLSRSISTPAACIRAAGSDWQVLSVEEQDYYVEDGAEYPCYLLTLTAAE